jgi:hypothetical protein
MLSFSCPYPALARRASALLFSAMFWIACAPPAAAVTVPRLYEATVPLTERSERGQSEALQEAMREVLVRVTGQRNAAYEPALAPLVNDAQRYVQQFRVVGTNQFFAGFDGAKLERLIVAAGQPLWGHERPATLVCLDLVEGAGRPIVDGRSASTLKGAIERAAALRGLPVIWPSGACARDRAEASASPGEGTRALAQEYAADAVLLGRVSSSTSGSWRVRWTLTYGSERSEWSGPPEEGPHGAADAFAGVFAAGSAQGDIAVTISVSGVNNLGAYAQVTDYLESLTLIHTLFVEELSGDTVIYRAEVRADVSRLARAIDLGNRLEPLQSAADPTLAAALSYRFRP